MAKKKKPAGRPHEHRWIVETFKNGHYYYKCFCGATITTDKPIR